MVAADHLTISLDLAPKRLYLRRAMLHQDALLERASWPIAETLLIKLQRRVENHLTRKKSRKKVMNNSNKKKPLLRLDLLRALFRPCLIPKLGALPRRRLASKQPV